MYILSEQLVKISSLLPSNLGRSMLVHHLVVASGLLRSESDTPVTNGVELAVVKPFSATREQLQTFHDDDYLGEHANPSHPLFRP